MHNLKIYGQLQEMAASEIKGLIDEKVYGEIKKTDKNPLFKSFVIGHEGESEGNVVGIGTIVKKWVRGVIQMMHEKLRIGTKIFLNHGKDNSQLNRQSIGRVVGKALRNVKDKLSVISIMYIKPEFRDQKTDMASIEAGFGLDVATSEITKINDITAIALGDSTKFRPGFSGATLQGALQEFADKNLPNDGKGAKKMTLKELKEAIKTGSYRPDDLFGRNEIEEISYVKNTKENRDRLSNEKNDNKIKLDKFNEMETKFKTEIEMANSDIKKYKNNEIKRGFDLDKVLETRKFNEVQTKFIKRNWDNFKVVEPDQIEKEVEVFLDNTIKDFEGVADIFDYNLEAKKDEGGTGEKNPINNLERDEDGFLKANPLLE